MAAIIDWQGTKDWLTSLGDVVKEGIGIFKEIQTTATGSSAGSAGTTSKQTGVSPNISASDLAFTPNWYLLGAGLFILLLVFLVKK